MDGSGDLNPATPNNGVMDSTSNNVPSGATFSNAAQDSSGISDDGSLHIDHSDKSNASSLDNATSTSSNDSNSAKMDALLNGDSETSANAVPNFSANSGSSIASGFSQASSTTTEQVTTPMPGYASQFEPSQIDTRQYAQMQNQTTQQYAQTQPTYTQQTQTTQGQQFSQSQQVMPQSPILQNQPINESSEAKDNNLISSNNIASSVSSSNGFMGARRFNSNPSSPSRANNAPQFFNDAMNREIIIADSSNNERKRSKKPLLIIVGVATALILVIAVAVIGVTQSNGGGYKDSTEIATNIISLIEDGRIGNRDENESTAVKRLYAFTIANKSPYLIENSDFVAGLRTQIDELEKSLGRNEEKKSELINDIAELRFLCDYLDPSQEIQYWETKFGELSYSDFLNGLENKYKSVTPSGELDNLNRYYALFLRSIVEERKIYQDNGCIGERMYDASCIEEKAGMDGALRLFRYEMDTRQYYEEYISPDLSIMFEGRIKETLKHVKEVFANEK